MTDSLAAGITAWLITYAIHSTVLLGLAWLILRIRRAGPDVADLMWKMALVGGIVTATAQSMLDVRPAGSLALGNSPAAAITLSQEPGSLPAAEPDESFTASPLAAGAAGERSSGREAAAGGSMADGHTRRVSLVGVTATAWLAVGLVLLAWYGGRRLILVGRLGDRRVLVDGELPAALAVLRREADVRRPIRLTTSNAISSPIALGRGEICLPVAALAQLEPAQQRAMLAHELAHLVRRDPQWLAFACALERLFFFQPLNRIARRGLQEAAEYRADEWAARRSGGVPLARCLVKVAEWIEASPLGVPVAGMAEERSQLSVRVTRLLERGAIAAPRRQPLASMLSVGALVATTLLAPGVAGRGPSPGAAIDPWSWPTDREVGLPAAAPDGPTDGTSLQQGSTTSTTAGTNVDHDVNRSRHVDGGVITSLDGGSVDAQRDTAVVRALMLRLRDDDAEVRRAAAHALGRIENPMAIPALVTALDDGDRDVVHAALDALSNFDRGVPAAPVRRLLQSPDAEVRQQAIHILGELRDRDSAPAIARMVRDPDADVRQQAIHALSEFRDPATAPVVAGAVSDEDPDVRQAALFALQELGGSVSDAVLVGALRDVHSDVREAALYLVQDRRAVALVPEVIRLLDDASPSVRECAAETLVELRTDPARTALRRALTHNDAKVRRIAVEFFGEEGDK